MAAPLLVGSDLRTASPETMEILLNKDVIAVDQDSLGAQGRVVKTDGSHLVFAKPLPTATSRWPCSTRATRPRR